MTVAAIIPAKSLALAKSRLSAVLSPAGRATLAGAMLRDVAEAALACPRVDTVIVVCADPRAADLVGPLGARVLRVPGDRGYTAAACEGLAVAAAEGFATAVVLPGDIPLIDAETLARLLAAHEEGGGLTLVPDRRHAGTNAFVSSPPGRMLPAFGPDSFARHVALARAAGIDAHTLPLPAIGLDIDVADDLDRLRGTPGAARHTRACLATLQGALAAERGVSP